MDFRYGKNVSFDFINQKCNVNSKNIISVAKKFAKLSNTQQTKCYICSGKPSKKVSSFFGIDYLMCLKCSHVYTNRRMSETDLIKYYVNDVDYFTNSYTNKKILKLRENIFVPKIQHIKKYAKGKDWLDVGSGDGTAISAIKSMGFNGVGIELNDSARKFAKKYRNITLYDKPFEFFVNERPKLWNVISFFGVLEHMADPMKALALSNKILKKNGIIAFGVPNYNSLSTKIQNLSKLPDRHLVPYSHIMAFTLKSAKYALQKAGFVPQSIWFWGMDVIELIKHIQYLENTFTNSDLYKILIKKLNQIQYIFDADGMGDEFLIIGKKIHDV